MKTKYNLWATNDGQGYFSPFVDIFEVSGGNQFETISKAQDEVESQLGVSLDWIAPPDTKQYDLVYGYRIHGTGSPDSYGEYNGVRYTITKIVPHVPIETALPTIEAVKYAIKKGDTNFSTELLINYLAWLEREDKS